MSGWFRNRFPEPKRTGVFPPAGNGPLSLHRQRNHRVSFLTPRMIVAAVVTGILGMGLLPAAFSQPPANNRPLGRTGQNNPGQLAAGQLAPGGIVPPAPAPKAGANGGLRELAEGLGGRDILSPQGMPSTLKILLLLTVLSLAPSILMMTTCFIRFVIVFGLLRQALGTQQLPPNQVIVSLSLFLTFLVMAPVWQEAYQNGIRPYTHNEPIPGRQPQEDPFDRALINTLRPLRQFMSNQIEMTDNADAVWMFLEYQHRNDEVPLEQQYQTYDDVPLSALLPAFMLSELKTAFVIGFQIYLPFLVIDLVVASVLMSMGMMMLPPNLISLPFKILLFVLVDGWFLTVGMLLESIRPYG